MAVQPVDAGAQCLATAAAAAAAAAAAHQNNSISCYQPQQDHTGRPAGAAGAGWQQAQLHISEPGHTWRHDRLAGGSRFLAAAARLICHSAGAAACASRSSGGTCGSSDATTDSRHPVGAAGAMAARPQSALKLAPNHCAAIVLFCHKLFSFLQIGQVSTGKASRQAHASHPSHTAPASD